MPIDTKDGGGQPLDRNRAFMNNDEAGYGLHRSSHRRVNTHQSHQQMRL